MKFKYNSSTARIAFAAAGKRSQRHSKQKSESLSFYSAAPKTKKPHLVDGAFCFIW
jgi:hypothetical protein